MKTPRGAAGGDLLLFIAFIVALGVVWVATGGPERAISRSGPFLGNSPFSEESNESIPTVDQRGGTSTDGSVITEISSRLLDLREGEERSPYAEHVSLSISTARKEDPNEEYLTLKTSRTLNGTLTISDWRLESSASNTNITIGPAAQLPTSGQVNTEFPIAVGANTTVYIASGRSPIGVSFRVNECTGYFEQFQDFEPHLPIECPFPIEELIEVNKRSFAFEPSIDCTNYVSTLGQCLFTDDNAIQNIDSQCRNFISNNLNYNGCVNLHSADAGFFKSEWRVYLEQDQELWAEDDERIRLLDESGRVIDVVSY